MSLSVRRVETAKPGRYTDRDGLMLWVRPSGARSWVLRHQVGGRRRDPGLGSYPEVPLAAAREKALAARRLTLEGGDPHADRARAKAVGLTFKAAVEAMIEGKRSGWRSAKHADQWTATLAVYVYPSLGERDVRTIDLDDVLGVLKPIWANKPETASRVRQRIEAVLAYATTKEARTGENPAR